MKLSRVRSILLLYLAAGPLFSQKPVINAGGIVNAASLAPITGGANPNPVALGSIVTVFGANLASDTRSAETVPLPTVLAGTSVLLNRNGVETTAPLFFVSPTQINFQAPAAGMGQIVVSRNGVRSNITPVATSDMGLGVFTLDGSGCGRAAIASVGPDGTWTLNTTANSASPGQLIVVLANGMGGYFLPPSGQPTPLAPLYPAFPDVSRPPFPFVSSISGILAGRELNASFAGKAPGLIGVDQANLPLPLDVVTGCSVPLQLFSNGIAPEGQASQRVPVSIQPGGGRCIDPPPNTLSEFTWVKTISDGFDPPIPTDSLRLNLVSGIGKRFASPARAAVGSCLLSSGVLYPVIQTAKVCSGFDAYDGLPFSPGALTLQFPEGSATFMPDGSALTYTAPLPIGTVHEGIYTIASSGTTTVAPFKRTTNVPAPFQLKTKFAAGMTIKSPLVIEWTGGDANSIVRLQLVSHGVNGDSWGVDCAEPATAGELVYVAPRDYGFGALRGSIELIISMSSEGNQLQTFSGPGLTQARHGWSFEYRYNSVIPSSH